MKDRGRPLRLFLDAGVVIEGCTGAWGAAKGVAILVTQRQRYTVVLAEQIEREVERAMARKSAALPAPQARALAADIAGWLARVRVERHPAPPAEIVQHYVPILLPAPRHINDLPAVLSTNRAHWNDAVADRTGLRIVTPQAFLATLSPLGP